ncbi:MAG: alpha/beta hydrolase [Armatimonadota bacterium]
MSRALQPLYISSGGMRLHGLLHGSGDGAVVVLAEPFAEEAKCARRVLTEVCWALVDGGLRVLRFDYRGCGDSDGEFESFDLDVWREDLRAAIAYARDTLAPRGLGLMGVRLGAVFAAETGGEVGANALVLVAPLLDGQMYWREQFRRTLIKARMTQGDQVSAEELRAGEQNEYFDLGGWLVPRRMRAQLEAVNLGPGRVPDFGGPCLVVDVGARLEPSPPLKTLAEGYTHGEVLAVRLEPFWQRIGLVDGTLLAQILAGWLGEKGLGCMAVAPR